MFDVVYVAIWKVVAAVAAVLAALAATGCSTGTSLFGSATITGTPMLEQPPTATVHTAAAPQGGEPIAPNVSYLSGQEATHAAYPELRSVDPCALHDPAAAVEVTGLEADEIMPGESLAECILAVEPADALSLQTWQLTVTVGATLSSLDREDAAEETIGDIAVLKLPDVVGSGRHCTYALPYGGPDTAIQLRVTRADNEEKTDPCTIAQKYLAKVSRYWVKPALRSDNITTPQLPVSAVDPCASLSEVAAGIDRPLHAIAIDPYRCSLAPAKYQDGDPPGGFVSVVVGMALDPQKLLDGPMSEGYRGLTVSGNPAVVSEGNVPGGAQSCSLDVAVDPDTVAVQADQSKSDATPTMQVIKVRAGDCEMATTAAEGVLALRR